jgi:hypothetical protein
MGKTVCFSLLKAEAMPFKEGFDLIGNIGGIQRLSALNMCAKVYAHQFGAHLKELFGEGWRVEFRLGCQGNPIYAIAL